MLILIPTERLPGENRVAATPATVAALGKLGFAVQVEAGAGNKAGFSDAAYQQAGATLWQPGTAPTLTQTAEQQPAPAQTPADCGWPGELVLKVNAPLPDEMALLRPGTVLVSFIWPAQNPELLQTLAARQITVLAMDMVPRISRAQALDALSSMSNIAGYRAVIEAAHHFGRFLTGQITAAGKVPPAKVLVIGAGVAGLAAIGAARSLGAIVRAFDTRLEVAEQIESLGGEFLQLDFGNEDGATASGYAKVMSDAFIAAEMALFAEQAREVDIIITTALIPGKPAPKLLTPAMVDSMQPGAVIVDLAAAAGGNSAYTQAGQVVRTDNGVTVIGYTDLPGRMPAQSSQLYATNLVNLAKLLCPQKDGVLALDRNDVIVRTMLVTDQGAVSYPPPPVSVAAAPPKSTTAKSVSSKTGAKTAAKHGAAENAALPSRRGPMLAAAAGTLLCLAGAVAPEQFLSHLTVFLLACVVGYYLVWNVTHALHTPLMSVTNAISGIIVLGALLQIQSPDPLVQALSFIAVLIATINIVGGFAVTRRMLNMFRKAEER